MDAIYNDRSEVLPCERHKQWVGPWFDDSLVIETLGLCDANGIHELPMPGLPKHVRGLVESLGQYQQAAADAAWHATTVRQ